MYDETNQTQEFIQSILARLIQPIIIRIESII